MVDMIDKFIHIFSGSSSAYGQTRKTDEFDDRGKHKTKSFIIKREPTSQMFQDHLDGKDPALGIIPINEKNKCRWACIDIDQYDGFDHKQLIDQIKKHKFPLIVCRSKSGGAHVFLFTNDFAPAAVFRSRLKEMAAKLGYANAEIFPKQNKVDMTKGGTGSFLNLPYHNANRSLRYAVKDDGSAMTLEEFFVEYDKVKLTEDQLTELTIEEEKDDTDLLKGAPPCLVALAKKGIGKGHRNNATYNFGVYLKKRYPNGWKGKLHHYNNTYCDPPMEESRVDDVANSVDNKDYQYKCKDDPIVNYCNAKKCVMQEFGIGDGLPETEIKEIQKYESDPPLYYVTIGDEQVEVDSIHLHDPDKFSLKCLEQINQAMPPVAKLVWRKAINNLLKNALPIEAPESTKIDVQLKEILTDYVTRSPGKDFNSLLLGQAYTEKGKTYFKFKDFWKFLMRTKSWPEKRYPKNVTARMLEKQFNAEEIGGKINKKSVRYIQISEVELNKPIIRAKKIEDPPFK
jgi:hypothetical protein